MVMARSRVNCSSHPRRRTSCEGGKATHVPPRQVQIRYSPAVAACKLLILKDDFGGEGGIRSRRTHAHQAIRRDRNRQNPPDPLEMPVSGTKQVQRNRPIFVPLLGWKESCSGRTEWVGLVALIRVAILERPYLGEAPHRDRTECQRTRAVAKQRSRTVRRTDSLTVNT